MASELKKPELSSPKAPSLPTTAAKSAAPIAAPVEINERGQLEAQLAEIDSKITALTKARAEVVKALDALILEAEGNPPPHENQIAIQTAIEKSKELRAERMARTQKLLDMGVQPSELAQTPVSPLDAAIAIQNRNKYAHRPMVRRPH